MEKLKQNYTSPRWSMEIPDCSMPMSMDTYSRCSYNCLYCFSFFQKSHTTKGYLTGQPRSVNPEKVIALFENAAVNNTAAANKTDVQFFKYIQDRRIMQWGGLADEFDEYEQEFWWRGTDNELSFYDGEKSVLADIALLLGNMTEIAQTK